MQKPQGKYFGWPGWTQRLDDRRSVMHDDYPLVIYFNGSRPAGHQWELWKCWDVTVIREDDFFLGAYPSCELAMDSIEGWAVMLLSKPLEKEEEAPITRAEMLGRLVRKTINRLRYY